MTMRQACADTAPHRPHQWIGQALRYDCPGRDYVLAGTGSRSLRTADRDTQIAAMRRCETAVNKAHAEHGDRLVVMSGGAEGFDELLARVAIHLHARPWLALPNRGYLTHYWGRASLLGRDRGTEAAELLAQAEQVTYVMEEVHGTTALTVDGLHAKFWRNRFMVDNATAFLVWDPTSRGTAHCLAAIRKARLPYEVLSPQPAALL